MRKFSWWKELLRDVAVAVVEAIRKALDKKKST